MNINLTASCACNNLTDVVIGCRKCPRLVKCHEKLSGIHPDGWWKPVSGCGDLKRAWLWIVGLAPGAKGAGMTGVPFTRDRSGVFLRSAMKNVGIDVEREVYISNVVRCVPPGNQPTRAEVKRCHEFLRREWELTSAGVVLCLGGLAWREVLRIGGQRRPFGHGAEIAIGGRKVVASYHVSPLNTNTGRLTADAFEDVLRRARFLSSRA